MRFKLLCIGPSRIRVVERMADTENQFCPDALRDVLQEALQTRRSAALQAPWQGLQTTAAEHQGALSVRMSDADAHPILTLGVASHKAHGRPLWRVLTALMPEECLVNNPEPPSRRWCAWVWHGDEEATMPPERQQLMQAFVLGVARAWMEKRSASRALPRDTDVPLFPEAGSPAVEA
ncbi:hypothetical protein GT347_01795 [Xylophilus rhododendri]|uniref:Uncharacterized protein n=1 Tax=Xylophilus rhododendri TaxID=2697032 RepID=A0A857J162_9BURK|nr:hypothetical protein [Xylophilus rhododendri]QHI96832.1 hypothetical protein GT347_01795 [Xylophilus rhododendri]